MSEPQLSEFIDLNSDEIQVLRRCLKPHMEHTIFKIDVDDSKLETLIDHAIDWECITDGEGVEWHAKDGMNPDLAKYIRASYKQYLKALAMYSASKYGDNLAGQMYLEEANEIID